MITTTRFKDVSREEIEQYHAAPDDWEFLRGRPIRIVCTPYTVAHVNDIGSLQGKCEGPFFEALGLAFPDTLESVLLCPHWIEVD